MNLLYSVLWREKEEEKKKNKSLVIQPFHFAINMPPFPYNTCMFSTHTIVYLIEIYILKITFFFLVPPVCVLSSISFMCSKFI